MASALTRNTAFLTLHIAPSRYSVKRVPGWLDRQPADQFPRAGLVLSIHSVWPQINIYPYLRMQNISVVPIDAATAMMPGGERVAVNDMAGGEPGYFWLNPANALVMLGIIHRDLLAYVEQSCLSPDAMSRQADALKRSFDSSSQQLRGIQLELDRKIGALEALQFAVRRQELTPLGQASYLPEVAFEQVLTGELPTLLITTLEPDHSKLADVPQHVSIWHVDDFSKYTEDGVISRWERNLSELLR